MDPNEGFAVVKRTPMIFRTLIALVVLAPLPFASVPAWSWSLAASIVGTAIDWERKLAGEARDGPSGV